MVPTKTGTINYPEYINRVAIIIGGLRSIANSEMNEEHSRFKRGSQGDQVDALGVRAELIVQHHLFIINTTFKAAALLTSRPVHSADVWIGNHAIDIKGVRSDATDLLVNKEAHHKVKGVTEYMFVQPISKDWANYWVFPFNEISRWGVKDCHYSDAFFKPLSELVQPNKS